MKGRIYFKKDNFSSSVWGSSSKRFFRSEEEKLVYLRTDKQNLFLKNISLLLNRRRDIFFLPFIAKSADPLRENDVSPSPERSPEENVSRSGSPDIKPTEGRKRGRPKGTPKGFSKVRETTPTAPPRKRGRPSKAVSVARGDSLGFIYKGEGSNLYMLNNKINRIEGGEEEESENVNVSVSEIYKGLEDPETASNEAENSASNSAEIVSQKADLVMEPPSARKEWVKRIRERVKKKERETTVSEPERVEKKTNVETEVVIPEVLEKKENEGGIEENECRNLIFLTDEEMNSEWILKEERVKIDDSYVNIRTGEVYTWEKDKKGEIVKNEKGEKEKKTKMYIEEPLPRAIYLKDIEKRKRYYIIMSYVTLVQKVNTKDQFIVRTIAASILASERFPKANIPRNESCIEIKNFTRSKEGILTEAWQRTKSPSSTDMINVSDNLNETKRYVYTGGVPTYKQIEETEALNIIKRWLDKFYEETPSVVCNVSFMKQLLNYITTNKYISKREFEENIPVGEPFKNKYVKLTYKSPKVEEIEYGPNIIVDREPFEAEYREPVFKENMIVLSKATMNFLEVICGSSVYNLTVLRAFIRNVITARYEGRNWQSAVYLYGAAGTAKSVWADLIKKLVHPGAVQEFNRHQNQFSVGQLANCEVLIVSDLTRITEKQVEVLKRVLGRDTLTHERKFESEFGVIAPYCQILIISNHPPQNFYLFSEDQAIMDKLIKVYLGPKNQVDPDLQIGNMSQHLDRYMSDILNWVLHPTQKMLQPFIRAVVLNEIHDAEQGTELKGMPAFIASCCYKKPGSFTGNGSIKAAYLKFLEYTGEGVKEIDRKRSEGDTAEILKRSLRTIFGEDLKLGRYSKRDQNNVRRYGIFDLEVTNGIQHIDLSNDEVASGAFKPISVSSGGKPVFNLENPFATDNVIAWMETGVPDEIDALQQEILKRRKLKEDKENNLANLIQDTSSVNPIEGSPQIESKTSNFLEKLKSENSREVLNKLGEEVSEEAQILNDKENYPFNFLE